MVIARAVFTACVINSTCIVLFRTGTVIYFYSANQIWGYFVNSCSVKIVSTKRIDECKRVVNGWKRVKMSGKKRIVNE